MIPFSEWLDRWTWRQGDHVSIVGPTGSGKTRLMRHLATRRQWVAWFASKRRDAELAAMMRAGWWRSTTGALPPDRERVLVWPRWPRGALFVDHTEEWERGIQHAWAAGGWCIAVDEVQAATDMGLGRHLSQFWRLGRSDHLSVLAATQRPVHVPVPMWSEATTLVVFSGMDKRDHERVAEIGQITRAEIDAAVRGIEPFSFIAVQRGEVSHVAPAGRFT